MKISSTKVKCYKACKRLYYLKYVEGLEYTQPIDALESGKSYHAEIEDMYNNDGWFVPADDPKIHAMATIPAQRRAHACRTIRRDSG